MISNGPSDSSPPSEVSSPLISIVGDSNQEKNIKKAVRKTKSKSSQDETPEPEDKDERKKLVSERRAEQNRQAQKSFRERKVKYVKDLEERLQIATEASLQSDMLKLENIELRSLIVSLQNENRKLRENLNFTPQVKPELLIFPFQNPETPKHVSFPLNGAPYPSSYEVNNPYSTPTQTTLAYPPSSSSSSSLLGLKTEYSSYSSQLENNINYYETTQLLSNYAAYRQELPPHSDFSSLVGNCDILTLDPESFLQGDPVLPLSAEDWNSLLETDSNKRSVEEASLYYNTPIPDGPIIFSRDEEGYKNLNQEMDLSDLLKKVQCKERNPELCKGTKFMKSL